MKIKRGLPIIFILAGCSTGYAGEGFVPVKRIVSEAKRSVCLDSNSELEARKEQLLAKSAALQTSAASAMRAAMAGGMSESQAAQTQQFSGLADQHEALMEEIDNLDFEIQDCGDTP